MKIIVPSIKEKNSRGQHDNSHPQKAVLTDKN